MRTALGTRWPAGLTNMANSRFSERTYLKKNMMENDGGTEVTLASAFTLTGACERAHTHTQAWFDDHPIAILGDTSPHAVSQPRELPALPFCGQLRRHHSASLCNS